jgi:IgA Peptidase M64
VLPGTPIPTTTNPDATCATTDPTSGSPQPPGTVGAYEGALTYHCSVFRPEFWCRMRVTVQTIPFCAVCQQQIRKVLGFNIDFTPTPVDGAAQVEPWPVTLRWKAGAFETSWEVQLSTDPAFPAATTQTHPTSATAVENGVKLGTLADLFLGPATTYYWRVRKGTLVGTSRGWTAPLAFTTAAKAAQPLSPKSTARSKPVYPWALTFSWTEVPFAKGYDVQVTRASDPGFGAALFPDAFVSGTKLQMDVLIEAKHLWRVRARPGGAAQDPVSFGPWSPAAPFTTLKPHVESVAPGNGEAVYPWPVKLEWTTVKAADHYVVEIARDEAGFGPESLMKSLQVPAPDTTASFNLRPHYAADNNHPFWRVRVFGPTLPTSPPLVEEGKASLEIPFLNAGDPTIVVVNMELTDPGGTGGVEQWALSFLHVPFAHVEAAKEYHLTVRRLDEAGNQQEMVWDEFLPREDDPSGQVGVVVLEVLGYGPGTLGYACSVVAIGPEGLAGLGGENDSFAFIWPGQPELIAPAAGSTDVSPDPAPNRFAFSHWYSPTGEWLIEFAGDGNCMNPIAADVVAGTPGSTIATAGPPLPSNSPLSWRVRALSNHWIGQSYPWSVCSTFKTAPPPVPPPDTPTVLNGWYGAMGVMLCMFGAVDNVGTYEVEAAEIAFDAGSGEPPDPAVVLASFGPFTFTDDQVSTYTQSVVDQLTGSSFSVPSGFRLIGLSGTEPLHAYKWRIRACNQTGCSQFSEWAQFAEIYPWPW